MVSRSSTGSKAWGKYQYWGKNRSKSMVVRKGGVCVCVCVCVCVSE